MLVGRVPDARGVGLIARGDVGNSMLEEEC